MEPLVIGGPSAGMALLLLVVLRLWLKERVYSSNERDRIIQSYQREREEMIRLHRAEILSIVSSNAERIADLRKRIIDCESAMQRRGYGLRWSDAPVELEATDRGLDRGLEDV